MNITLASLGWVTDAPAGNRLRWHYPLQTPDGGGFLDLPETIIVERAWLDEDIPTPDYGTGLLALPQVSLPPVPFSWWDGPTTVNLGGFVPLAHTLSRPVQAVRFTYRGPATRLLVYDSDADRLVFDRMLADGQPVILSAAAMDLFVFLTYSATLENFYTLDLYLNRKLDWHEIARIHVRETLNASLDQAARRYDLPPTLSKQEWDEFVQLAQEGEASSPATLVEGEPSAWEAFMMATGIRWEHALLFGHAFFDGPRNELPDLDEIAEDLLLPAIPPTAVAYRVREAKKRVGNSNLVVCPPWPAAPLIAPGQPQYQLPAVRLTTDVDTGQPKFEATYGLTWGQVDPLALGVEIVEEISPSPTIGSAGESLTYHSRSRLPEDPPLEGILARAQDVPFHDVKLRCRARATDGWDRVSAFSPWTPYTALNLIHEPQPPALLAARHQSGTARLTRQTGDPNFPDWQPDLVVKNDAGARLFIYRRTASPIQANVTVGNPLPVSGGRYRATVSGSPVTLSTFLKGFLSVPPFKATIIQVGAGDVTFELGDGETTLFSAGPGQLLQSPQDLSLWTKVADFAIPGLPAELLFADPVPGPSGKADVLSYQARLSFLGRIGPPGNSVQALRIPPVPVVPPPFDVEMLGVDFYNRTMVKITLTTPVSSGLFTIWWAEGALNPAQFDGKGVPGEYRAQSVYQQRYLFDVLAIPLPQTAARTITIGLQQVNEGGGQSPFKTVQVSLPALAP